MKHWIEPKPTMIKEVKLDLQRLFRLDNAMTETSFHIITGTKLKKMRDVHKIATTSTNTEMDTKPFHLQQRCHINLYQRRMGGKQNRWGGGMWGAKVYT